MSAENRSVACDADMDDAASPGGLKCGELALAETVSPIRPEAAMGRAGNGVLVDPGARSEETGHKIVSRVARSRCDDYAPHVNLAEPGEIRRQLPHQFLGRNFDKVIKLVAADAHCGNSQGVEQARRRR